MYVTSAVQVKCYTINGVLIDEWMDGNENGKVKHSKFIFTIYGILFVLISKYSMRIAHVSRCLAMFQV